MSHRLFRIPEAARMQQGPKFFFDSCDEGMSAGEDAQIWPERFTST